MASKSWCLPALAGGDEEKGKKKLSEDVSRVLIALPEAWTRSKRQYVRLIPKGSTTNDEVKKFDSPVWLGRKYDFSPNGAKAKIDYGDDDIWKLTSAPDSSILQIRSDRGQCRFEKISGRWVRID